jgi:CBS domain-containing protein
LAGTLGAFGMNLLRVNSQGGGNTQRHSQSGQSSPRRIRARPAQQQMSAGAISGDDGGFDLEEEIESMNVSNIMTPSPATCHRSTKLQEIARLMHQCDCGAIPVVEEGTNHPVGIVTDRDITIRAVSEGRNPLDLTAGDCMTSPIETISCDASLDQCCDKMESSQVRRMVVVDQDGKICGIVAQADIAMYAPEEETAELVHDVSAPAPMPTI